MNDGKPRELTEVSLAAPVGNFSKEASFIPTLAVGQQDQILYTSPELPDAEDLVKPTHLKDDMDPRIDSETNQAVCQPVESALQVSSSPPGYQEGPHAEGCDSTSNEERPQAKHVEDTLLVPGDNPNNLPEVEVWAKLIENSGKSSAGSSNAGTGKCESTFRLVEYIGDQFHQKNPHTRRTIILNQKRNSDNDPIVFYRFYQFCCPCLGKVWFSPLHRARFGCYCRDCHQYLAPFGHVDGLTPYMGHELCYAKFQCHRCGRSWSCQKSRSNFPDNCFSCGTIVYPYYQVSHSVLQKKISRNEPLPGPIPHPGPFTDMIPFQPTVPSVDEDEEYQMCEPEPESEDEYFDVDTDMHESSDADQSVQDEDDVSVIFHPEHEMRTRSSYSNICLPDRDHHSLSLKSQSERVLCRSVSDTFLLEKHRYWEKKHDARIGFRYHLHRK